MMKFLKNLGWSSAIAIGLFLVTLIPFIAWAAEDNKSDSFPWPLRVGVLGSVSSIWGIFITFLQVVGAKSAANQARESSESARIETSKAIRELRNKQHRAANAFASRLLGDIRVYLSQEKWLLAAIRISDLADHVLAISQSYKSPDREWQSIRNSLIDWDLRLRAANAEQNFRYHRGSWQHLCDKITEKLAIELEVIESEAQQ